MNQAPSSPASRPNPVARILAAIRDDATFRNTAAKLGIEPAKGSCISVRIAEFGMHERRFAIGLARQGGLVVCEKNEGAPGYQSVLEFDQHDRPFIVMSGMRRYIAGIRPEQGGIKASELGKQYQAARQEIITQATRRNKAQQAKQ